MKFSNVYLKAAKLVDSGDNFAFTAATGKICEWGSAWNGVDVVFREHFPFDPNHDDRNHPNFVPREQRVLIFLLMREIIKTDYNDKEL